MYRMCNEYSLSSLSRYEHSISLLVALRLFGGFEHLKNGNFRILIQPIEKCLGFVDLFDRLISK